MSFGKRFKLWITVGKYLLIQDHLELKECDFDKTNMIDIKFEGPLWLKIGLKQRLDRIIKG